MKPLVRHTGLSTYSSPGRATTCGVAPLEGDVRPNQIEAGCRGCKLTAAEIIGARLARCRLEG